jgi:hypothetical protein
MVICPTLLYLNSITALLLPRHEVTQMDLPLVLGLSLDPVHLLAFIETPKSVQAASNGVERPMQAFLVCVTAAQGQSIV